MFPRSDLQGLSWKGIRASACKAAADLTTGGCGPLGFLLSWEADDHLGGHRREGAGAEVATRSTGSH